MTPVLVALATLLFGSAGAYASGKVRRGATRVRNRRREAERDIERAESILESRERALQQSARSYADQQLEDRLAAVDLDTLKGQTSGRVKFAPLEDAGYRNVADLVGKSRAELRAVQGVGPVSAKAIEAAVRRYVESAREIAPDLPGPDLAEKGSEDLARDAIVYLEAFRELGGPTSRMKKELAPIDERAAEAIRDGTFGRWLTGWLKAGRNAERVETLEALAAELEKVRESDAFREAAEARDRLARSGTMQLSREEVRERFRAEFADASSLLDQTFGDIGGAPRATGVVDAAPEQRALAERVEAFPLELDGLGVVLRRYQKFGAQYMMTLQRTVLGDEMGLGKTIQTLAAQVHLHNTREYAASLVVAPASILANWLHEIGNRTPLNGHLLHGDGLEEALAAWTREGGVAVTSYSTLRRTQDLVLEQGPPEIALLVADEAHFAKNPESGRTKALRRAVDKADNVVFLSGTPMENHPEEFVHLLDSLNPARARDLGDYLKAPGMVLGGAKHFHAEIADVYLRRNQEDVLTELPPRIEKDEWVHLRPGELAAYAMEVGEGNLMGMRTAVTVSSDEETSGKFNRLGDILEEYRESDVKVLLFSYFHKVLEEVQRRHETIGRIVGSVSPEKRFELVQRFNEAEGHQLLVAQIDAAGTGLNLQSAGAVIIMEPQFKPSTEAQAIARAHRMGQTRRVVVHRLLARNCVDERLVEILEKKQDLFETFARESLIKDASVEATASTPMKALVEAEQKRLNS